MTDMFYIMTFYTEKVYAVNNFEVQVLQNCADS